MQSNSNKLNAPDPRALWQGPLVNLLFMGFYWGAGALMHRHIILQDSYGERSTFILPLPLAIVIALLLIAEPFALVRRIAYQNYRLGDTRTLRIHPAYLVISSIIRVFVRLVISIAVLESCNIEVEHGGVWPYLILTYFMFAEIFLGVIINSKQDRITIKPNLWVEIIAQFICLALLALIAAYFDEVFIKEYIVTAQWQIAVKGLMVLLFFLLLYVPNRIIDFYIGWIQQKTMPEKLLYAVSVLAVFAIIIYNRLA